jgi:hypothetical protein
MSDGLVSTPTSGPISLLDVGLATVSMLDWDWDYSTNQYIPEEISLNDADVRNAWRAISNTPNTQVALADWYGYIAPDI